MSSRQELISQALQKRYIEVCTNARTLDPTAFGDQKDLVAGVRQQLVDGRRFPRWEPPAAWLSCRLDCLSALRSLAAGDHVEGTSSGPTVGADFLQRLQAASRDPRQRFELLIAQYRYPLNFVASTERFVQEHILERLMVADRAHIERQSPNAVNVDDLLLKLNLLAINASFSDDLRFLDALNYYYELLPSNWYPNSKNNWLIVSFWSFYARALTVELDRIK